MTDHVSRQLDSTTSMQVRQHAALLSGRDFWSSVEGPEYVRSSWPTVRTASECKVVRPTT